MDGLMPRRRSRAPRPNACIRLLMRANSAAGERTVVRAAASSMARGRPSSRWQISAMAPALSSVSAKVRIGRSGPLHEEGDGRRLADHLERGGPRCRNHERRDGVNLFALDVKRGPAGGQDLQRGAALQEHPDEGGRF